MPSPSLVHSRESHLCILSARTLNFLSVPSPLTLPPFSPHPRSASPPSLAISVGFSLLTKPFWISTSFLSDLCWFSYEDETLQQLLLMRMNSFQEFFPGVFPLLMWCYDETFSMWRSGSLSLHLPLSANTFLNNFFHKFSFLVPVVVALEKL